MNVSKKQTLLLLSMVLVSAQSAFGGSKPSLNISASTGDGRLSPTQVDNELRVGDLIAALKDIQESPRSDENKLDRLTALLDLTQKGHINYQDTRSLDTFARYVGNILGIFFVKTKGDPKVWSKFNEALLLINRKNGYGSGMGVKPNRDERLTDDVFLEARSMLEHGIISDRHYKQDPR